MPGLGIADPIDGSRGGEQIGLGVDLGDEGRGEGDRMIICGIGI